MQVDAVLSDTRSVPVCSRDTRRSTDSNASSTTAKSRGGQRGPDAIRCLHASMSLSRQQRIDAITGLQQPLAVVTQKKSLIRYTSEGKRYWRWRDVVARVLHICRGASADDYSLLLQTEHWLEACDAKHRYGSNLKPYFKAWLEADTHQSFFKWLDEGEGADVDIEERPRMRLDSERVVYCGIERCFFEVKITSGQLRYCINNRLVTTDSSLQHPPVPPTWRKDPHMLSRFSSLFRADQALLDKAAAASKPSSKDAGPLSATFDDLNATKLQRTPSSASKAAQQQQQQLKEEDVRPQTSAAGRLGSDGPSQADIARLDEKHAKLHALLHGKAGSKGAARLDAQDAARDRCSNGSAPSGRATPRLAPLDGISDDLRGLLSLQLSKELEGLNGDHLMRRHASDAQCSITEKPSAEIKSRQSTDGALNGNTAPSVAGGKTLSPVPLFRGRPAPGTGPPSLREHHCYASTGALDRCFNDPLMHANSPDEAMSGFSDEGTEAADDASTPHTEAAAMPLMPRSLPADDPQAAAAWPSWKRPPSRSGRTPGVNSMPAGHHRYASLEDSSMQSMQSSDTDGHLSASPVSSASPFSSRSHRSHPMLRPSGRASRARENGSVQLSRKAATDAAPGVGSAGPDARAASQPGAAPAAATAGPTGVTASAPSAVTTTSAPPPPPSSSNSISKPVNAGFDMRQDMVPRHIRNVLAKEDELRAASVLNVARTGVHSLAGPNGTAAVIKCQSAISRAAPAISLPTSSAESSSHGCALRRVHSAVTSGAQPIPDTRQARNMQCATLHPVLASASGISENLRLLELMESLTTSRKSKKRAAAAAAGSASVPGTIDKDQTSGESSTSGIHTQTSCALDLADRIEERMLRQGQIVRVQNQEELELVLPHAPKVLDHSSSRSCSSLPRGSALCQGHDGVSKLNEAVTTTTATGTATGAAATPTPAGGKSAAAEEAQTSSSTVEDGDAPRQLNVISDADADADDGSAMVQHAPFDRSHTAADDHSGPHQVPGDSSSQQHRTGRASPSVPEAAASGIDTHKSGASELSSAPDGAAPAKSVSQRALRKLNRAADGTKVVEGQREKWIYVWDMHSRLYINRKLPGRFHHSSFVAGGAVKAAGSIVVENGVLKQLTTWSGHYRPRSSDIALFLEWLEGKNINMDSVELLLVKPNKPNSKMNQAAALAATAPAPAALEAAPAAAVVAAAAVGAGAGERASTGRMT